MKLNWKKYHISRNIFVSKSLRKCPFGCATKKVDNSKIPNNVKSATQKLRSKQQQQQKESFNA